MSHSYHTVLLRHIILSVLDRRHITAPPVISFSNHTSILRHMILATLNPIHRSGLSWTGVTWSGPGPECYHSNKHYNCVDCGVLLSYGPYFENHLSSIHVVTVTISFPLYCSLKTTQAVTMATNITTALTVVSCFPIDLTLTIILAAYMLWLCW